MKKIHKEAEAALKKTQEEIKRYADRGRKETEVWKKGGSSTVKHQGSGV